VFGVQGSMLSVWCWGVECLGGGALVFGVWVLGSGGVGVSGRVVGCNLVGGDLGVFNPLAARVLIKVGARVDREVDRTRNVVR
jgi:hypothetical protein